MQKEFVVVTQAAAPLQLQLYEIPQRLGVTILVFVVMDVNLRNVVEETFSQKYLFEDKHKKRAKWLFF